MSADPPVILIVEDDPGTALLQRRQLERAGFRVEQAGGVDAAMNVLGRTGVDLVIIDYRLGATTGLDLNRRLKAAGFDIPVIIVSGSIDDAAVIEAMRAGVKDVVVKSLDYLDYLPDAVRGVLAQAAAAAQAGAGGDRPGTSVLIVDDDEGVATLQRRQLQRAGYDVDVAQTPQEALIRVRKGQVHLALLDLRLGNASGLDLYEEIKAGGWNIPAILVTGFADQAVAIRALRAGVRDVVPKTAEYLEYLPAAVDRVVSQVRVEGKLIESELRLASIIGTAMDAIVMCDDALRIVLFNLAAEAMFGVAAAEALTRTLPSFLPALQVLADARAPAALQRRLEIEGIHAAGGTLPVEVTVNDMHVHGRRLFTVIARDITDRRRAEAELRDADHRKDVFLGMLAHELRNPLAAIRTAGEVLHRTTQDPAALKLTSVIKRQTSALARMVDELLDVSRVTLGKIQVAQEPVVLDDVVARAVEGARESARSAGLDLDLTTEAAPIWLTGDATRLEQVVANLLTNAVKFTRPGGRIGVRVERDGTEALVRVRDTGIGMDAGLLPKVFDLFVQGDTSLDRAQSGLGIGLALVRQVVQMHGGRVLAHSDGPGRGSEFTVVLPALSAAPADVAAPAVEVPSVSGVIDVLVVDDQPDLADAVALLIDALGHRGRAAYGGAEGVAAALDQRPDLMLVDIGMPGMTGYDVAREVRRDPALADVRLVALTGYGREEDRARVLDAGFDLHLTKPVADDKLRDVLAWVAGPPGAAD